MDSGYIGGINLFTIEVIMKTLQDAFTKSAEHLLSQGCQSNIDEKSMCAYRGDSGRKCFIGALINDAEYSEALEGGSIGEYENQIEDGELVDVVLKAVAASGWPDDYRAEQMYKRGQHIHDNLPTDTWREELQILASDFDLTFNARG